MDSQRYTAMADEDVVNEMVENLALVFNVSETFVRNKLVDHVIKRWGLDPFTLGGFALAAPNEV